MTKMARFNLATSAGTEEIKGVRKISVPSVLATIDKILQAISEAKHNKAHAERFSEVLKRLINTLSGVDVNFVRSAEFYHDLKETLNKIYAHIIESTTRGKWAKIMMAKRDQKVFNDISIHVDNLIGRIIFSYAQRVQLRKNSPSPSTSSRVMVANTEGATGSDGDLRPDSACSVGNSDISYSSNESYESTQAVGR